MGAASTTAADAATAPGAEAAALDLALMNSRIEATARAMMNTLLRSARSAVLSVARDFSCVVLTADDRLLEVAESVPIHVYGAAELIVRSMRELHPDFKPGDAFLHNSPYHGGSHASDWSVVVPVFDDGGRHRFTVLAMAHVADTGNSQPTGSMAHARDVYEEGALIFPCVRVQEDYADIEDIIRICMLRIRAPRIWHGDFRAILGAARIGERRMRGLLTEYGAERLAAYCDAWFDYSERLIEAEIGQLPSGEISVRGCHDPIDGFPEGIPVNTTVRVDATAGRVEVDLRDNLDDQPFGLNLTEGTSRSAALLGVLSALGKPVPANHGSFRRIEVQLRENCIVGAARHPASCSMATTKLSEIVSTSVALAFAELADGYGLAEAGRPLPASCAYISGHDPRPGKGPFVNLLMLAVAHGPGSPHEDGWLTYQGMGSSGVTSVDSVEIDELKYPMLISTLRLEPDSEGAGRFRGAPAAHVEYGPVAGAKLEISYRCDGTHTPPRGVRGGADGALMRTLRRRPDGSLEELPGFGRLELAAGEAIVSVCNGGGGYGPPLARRPERVAHDVAEGWVSPKRAERVYGVVCDQAGRLDAAATAARREGAAEALA